MFVSAGSSRSCHLREGGLLAVHLSEGFKRERTHSVGHQVFRRNVSVRSFPFQVLLSIVSRVLSRSSRVRMGLSAEDSG